MSAGKAKNDQPEENGDATPPTCSASPPRRPVSPMILPANATISALSTMDDNAAPLPGAAVSAGQANRALMQYLLTDQEARELSTGAGSIASNSNSEYSSDTGDEGDIEGSDSETASKTARRRSKPPSRRKPSIADPLLLPSGSITYDLYRWHRNHQRDAGHYLDESSVDDAGNPQLIHTHLEEDEEGHVHQTAARCSKRHIRTRSLSVMEAASAGSEYEWDLPQSHAQITGPNGFRRDYMLRKAEDEGRNVSMLTSSFVEFLALYGHFAGGDFPSDEDDEDDGEDEDEDDSTNAVVVAEVVGSDDHSGRSRGSDDEQQQRLIAPLQHSASYGAVGSSHRPTAGKPSANGRLSSRHNFKQPASLGGSSTRIAKQPATSLSSKASVRKSFFLLLKSFIGSGVLFLPKAFYNGGLLFSCVIMLVSAIVSLYTMLLLIKCYEKVHCGYGEMGRRLYGKWMEKAVLLSIVVSQIGFACAGTIFVATNMRDLFNAVTDCNHRMPLSFWVVIQLIVLAPLCLIRHIKGLSSIALLADLFIVAGLIYVWWMDVSKISKLGIEYVRNFNPEDYSLFIGTAAYTFEGYALILPIVDAMQRPEKFPAVLSVVMAICTAVAVAMGGLSYSAFGDKTESIILLNMPSSTLMTLTVQLLYSLAMIFTLPLMMFPVIRILEQALFPRRSGKRNPAVKMQKNTFRMLLLVVVVVISIVGVEKLDRLIAIVGGFACIPIAFIYPPLFHLKSIARSNWERIRDAFLAFFGFVVCVYVTAGAVSRWGKASPPFDFCDVQQHP
ncbi:hypothetical protein GGI25_005401 [Coemansia spiralis]|uniref:Amino acid transporter transmembrane domain-containing protein n=2 Tax=Coemansia TaxID=4863 RepID=A0A9W8G2Z1_9FUNG|nr:hypothetical protein EDC05_003577 [Coemansia umbellata]KAJ2621185.1 hypothetical protein GGI26_004354 [Coemansia sp. RSA 1358]KAJ2671710.1 hypothetical protein GGI25_005401 [Coemansia spiralis]